MQLTDIFQHYSALAIHDDWLLLLMVMAAATVEPIKYAADCFTLAEYTFRRMYSNIEDYEDIEGIRTLLEETRDFMCEISADRDISYEEMLGDLEGESKEEILVAVKRIRLLLMDKAYGDCAEMALIVLEVCFSVAFIKCGNDWNRC